MVWLEYLKDLLFFPKALRGVLVAVFGRLKVLLFLLWKILWLDKRQLHRSGNVLGIYLVLIYNVLGQNRVLLFIFQCFFRCLKGLHLLIIILLKLVKIIINLIIINLVVKSDGVSRLVALFYVVHRWEILLRVGHVVIYKLILCFRSF